ncbi:NlpC/P60 family protein [Kitasatospora sp. LaBMicrA B282]|uniref:C40 family peptidase n=1 Tax=Kitasatospora sp. LaBMicrA B282 TaxID=3420949 RepID=UPI003D0D354C
MKPDQNPDQTSAGLIADPTVEPPDGRPRNQPPVDPDRPGLAADPHSAEGGGHHRATRLRHKVGLAAAIVAGAGSIGLGADVANAATLPEHPAAVPGLVSADDDGSAGYTDDQGSDDQGYGDDQGDGGDQSHADDQGDGSDQGYGDDQSSTDSGSDPSDNASDSSGNGSGTDDAGSGGLKQGWDGSVYWFQNSAGEWRYTSHRDYYLNRIGATGDDTGTTSSGSSGSSGGTDDSGSGSRSEAATGDVESAVEFAEAQLGKPFEWGGNGPGGYDCSGLAQQAFLRAGISLPRIADEQYGATTPVSASRMQRGDLLFWSYDGTVSGIHHVAIYLGDNRYVEAAHPGTSVRTETLNSGYRPSFVGRP